MFGMLARIVFSNGPINTFEKILMKYFFKKYFTINL